MEEASLPLSYHCRNARLFLKKAAFCKKSALISDELSHLRKFETLVASTIPSHPLFSISSKEKQVFELLHCLPDCRRRIRELATELTHNPCPHKTASESLITLPNTGKMSSNGRGIPPDSPALSASRRASGSGDSPSKKQQSWGIWTANPQHDPSQLSSNSPIGVGGLSPPSSRKRTMLKGKKPAFAAAAKEPIVVPALPLRSSSPDQRMQTMIGGCALVVNQLQPQGDKKYDTRRKAACPEAESSMTPGSKSRSVNLQMESTSKRPSEMLLAPPKGAHYIKAQKERSMTPPLYAERGQKSPDKAAQRFRFASQFLEKRLKDRMEHIQRQFPDTDEDGSASSPTKMRISSDRLTGDMTLQEGGGSSAEESAGLDASSSTLEMFTKHLNHGTDPTAITGRLQRMALADQEEISTERSQLLSSTDETWARKLVPFVEQKLCHDMLQPRSATQKATPRSNRKRNRKRGVLGVMDDVIRCAVDSDSAVSNVASPRFLASGQDDTSGKKTRNDDALEQKAFLQGLQSEELEAKFTSLQDLVGELRRCIEGFTARVEEEGDRWQSEMQGLEKNICMWKEDTEIELVGMKKGLKDEMQKMMDEVRIGLIRVERLVEDVESSKEKQEFTNQAMEHCDNGVDSVQQKMESLVASMKVDLLLELKEKITSGMRRDLDVFELGISKQFEGMKREMETALVESEKLQSSERQHIEALIDEKVERQFSQHMGIASGSREKVITDMKNELRLLWVEVDMLSKGREEMKDTVEQLAHVAKEAKQSISEEQNVLKSENGILKKQLHYFKKESMQVRADTDDFKKDMEIKMENIRSSMERMKEEGKCMKSLVDNVLEAEELRRNKGEDSRENSEGAHERMLIMEKVEGISQLYLGGLEDVRSELLSFKLECQDRMDDLEAHCADLSRYQQEQEKTEASDAQLPLGELVLDGLETRVAHIESRLEQNCSLEDERHRTLVAMEKDREQTSATLDHVASAAQKADEFVSEMVGSFSSELATVMRQSHKILESLGAERDTATASAVAVKKMSEDMEREMQIAMIVISEAKAKGLKIQEGIEKEISGLKGSILLEKEAAAVAGANASDAAAKAEAALVEIHKMQSESFAISEDIAEAASHAYTNYSKELESHLEEWRKVMHVEVTRAQLMVQGIEEEKQRIQGLLDYGEKPVSQKDFEQHLRKAEDVVAEMERSVREMSANMEAQRVARLADIEQKDATMRHEIEDLKEKVEQAVSRLEEASRCNERSNTVVDENLHTVDDLMQDMQNLESKISETAAAQVETTEKVTEYVKKVRKLESMQLSTATSVEEVQASTGDLQKSASLWLQKYDAAARLLQDLEKRTLTLESSFSRGGEHLDDKLDSVDLSENMQPAQKERLINLYGELSGFVQRMKAHEGDQDDCKDGTGWTPLDTRLVSLENRVAQVETETVSNLRVLDVKMEDFSVGVQTALEGASMAESKCSALGGELVKLFRMIATTRKESPSKMMTMMDVTAGIDEFNNEQQQHHHHHHQHQFPPPRSGRSVALKSKGQTACNYCKKAATKGNSGDTIMEGGRGDDGSHNHAGFSEAYPSSTDGINNFYNNETGDVEQRSPEGFDRSLRTYDIHGKQSPQHHGTSRDLSPTFKIAKQQLQKDKDEPTGLESMWRRATSEGRILEGKLPITLDERRVETTNKVEGVQISSGKPELQLTNIRLEAGKVHVNVSHRPPSSLTGLRGMKRGDAMSAAQP